MASGLLNVLLERLQKQFPQRTLASDLELIALFCVYQAVKINNGDIDKVYSPFKKSLQQTLDDISREGQKFPELSHLLRTPKQLMTADPDFIETLVDLCFQAETQLSDKSFIDVAIQMQLTRQANHQNYQTPRQVFQIMDSLYFEKQQTKPDKYYRVLDMHANTCSLSQHLAETTPSPDKNVSIDNFCDNPWLTLINTLAGRLSLRLTINTTMVTPHDFNSLSTPGFDFIFANPPFSNYQFPNDKGNNMSMPARYLHTALSLVAPGGKIAMLVPSGLLFRTDKHRREYDLRSRLTDDRQVQAIITLPDTAFDIQSKVKTALLIIDTTSSRPDMTFIALDKSQWQAFDQVFGKLKQGLNAPQTLLKDDSFKAVQVPVEQVIAQNYDWQMSRYQKDQTGRDRPLAEIKRDIADVEQQLVVVKAAISGLLTEMEQKQ